MFGADKETTTFSSKVFFTSKIAIATIVISLAFLVAFDLILLVFAGILVAILFRGIADFISEKTPLSSNVSLAIIMLSFIVLTVLLSYLMAPAINEQIQEFKETLPEALKKSQDWLSQFGWTEKIKNGDGFFEFMQGGDVGIMSRAGGALSGLAQGILQIFIIFIVGFYLAVNPEIYTKGFIKLFPLNRRKRIKEVMTEMNKTLKWWLVGRFIDMAFVGALTWIALGILNVPLAFILALIAAILNFIPNLGPFLGAIPALLIGFVQGPETALYIAIVFFVIQSLESTVITPLIQQKAISLPPAFTITTQVMLGTAFGTLGLTVATPLVAAIIIAIQMLYIQDTLGDHTPPPQS